MPVSEPSETATEGLHFELAAFEIFLVHGGDFQFAACRGADAGGDIDHGVRIEIETDHGIVGLRLLGFLFDGGAVALRVEGSHAVAFGVVDAVAENGGFALLLCRGDGRLEHSAEACAVENVVAEHETHAVIADEFAADEEGLRQTVGRGLLGVSELHPEIGTVAQQTAETGQIVGRGDDENVAYAGEHQYRNGIVDHRFVEDGKQLFADPFGDGIEARAATSGKDNSFHGDDVMLKSGTFCPKVDYFCSKVERFLLKSGVLLLESRVGLATTCALLKVHAPFSFAFSLSGVRSLDQFGKNGGGGGQEAAGEFDDETF